MFLISFLLHLFAVLALNHIASFRPVLREAATYYVDIVSLPSIEPAAATAPSSPSPAPAAARPSAPPPPPAPAKPAMTIPDRKAATPSTQSTKNPVQDSREDEAREFAQRMSRLERNADARHQAEALATLQKKAAEKKSAGGPANTGSDKGSDYGAYIQSRLKDALATTIVYRSRSPEAAVRLYLDKNGKLVRYVMERPSGDKLFNDSVIRTIEKAKANFPPTPNGASYDKLFVFSPLEVAK
jgi:colicin import membrane protein